MDILFCPATPYIQGFSYVGDVNYIVLAWSSFCSMFV
jgi:hypothetical protein